MRRPRRVIFAIVALGLFLVACSDNASPVEGGPSAAATGTEPGTSTGGSILTNSVEPDVAAAIVAALEAGPIDLEGFEPGLESCEQLDVEALGNIVGQAVMTNDVEIIKDNEPTSAARVCVLYAEDDPEVDLIRIIATANTGRWSNTVIYNQQLSEPRGELGDALGAPLEFAWIGGDNFGFSTITLDQGQSSLTVEARTQISGVDFQVAAPHTLAALAQISARQLTSPGPGSGSATISTCGDLAPSAFSPFVQGNLGPFVASSFHGALTCTATTAEGSIAQVVVSESDDQAYAIGRAATVADAYRKSYRDLRELDAGADVAWAVDRLFDDDPDATRQSTLLQGFGARDGVFARVGFRVDTKVERLPDRVAEAALAAVFDGTSPTETEPAPPPTIKLSGPVGEFVSTGAKIQVAPLTRGLAACSDLDIAPFEKITGRDLLAVAVRDAEPSDRSSVVCDLVHADDETLIEIRLAAATSQAGEADWDIDVSDLVELEGIDDQAFWNEGDDGVLALYVVESDARLFVEVTKHEWTPDVDLFWNAQQAAKVLLNPAS